MSDGSDGWLPTWVGELWLVRHPFEVLGRSLHRVRDPADPDELPQLQTRYRSIARRGLVAVRVRTVLLVLFYFSAIVAVVGGVGGIVGRFAFLDTLYQTTFALSAGFSLLFGAGASIINRYIGVLQNRLVILAVRIHGARGRAEEA